MSVSMYRKWSMWARSQVLFWGKDDFVVRKTILEGDTEKKTPTRSEEDSEVVGAGKERKDGGEGVNILQSKSDILQRIFLLHLGIYTSSNYLYTRDLFFEVGYRNPLDFDPSIGNDSTCLTKTWSFRLSTGSFRLLLPMLKNLFQN